MFKERNKRYKKQIEKPLPQSPYEKLIYAIENEKEAEAEKLIIEMDTTELSKIDYTDNSYTALIKAAQKGSSKICEQLIPKMSDEAINYINSNSNTTLSLAITKG